MSQRPKPLIARTVTSPAFDVRIAQSACWLAAALILVLGALKLTQLPLTEVQLFFGLLLVLNLSMLCVVLGMVLPLTSRTEQDQNSANLD